MNLTETIRNAAAHPDQVFVILKAGILERVPEGIQPVISIGLSIVGIMAVFPLLFALITLMERKILGRIQNRYGPNRVGPCGLFQPIADGIKMLIKENIVPYAAIKWAHFMAPVLLMFPAFLALSVIPYGRNMTPIELDAGLVFFFALGAFNEIAVFMAGWSSRNKYSLLGAMRAIAQMISYDIPLVLSTIPVIMMAGSLSLPDIVNAQAGYHFDLLPRWFILTPWGIAGSILFLIAAMAESNRCPFDIPEGESEIIAGHLTEYSGFKFAMFFMSEYIALLAASAVGVTLFLGGWHAPFPFLQWVPSYIWFFSKLISLIFLYIWIRGTLPRIRVDHLMNLAWKFLVPLSLLNLGVCVLWHYSRSWTFPGGQGFRWLLCFAIIAIAYEVLGRKLSSSKTMHQRVYRFVE
ncbi:MAG TPA: NADH-quinone oxidoreductase subunit NuoH [Verrucomicrobiales bacterium]|nr:NADH-quinone oxidoreductase subunit NuoH [Verrucomicrobiales bacterium]HIL68717.1 NADH-quinone oxidoreductase subunit NuoH [Verrucomicrobiota bacterium]